MIVLKNELLNAAKEASKAMRPSDIPVMKCLKLDVVNGKLQITGSSPVITIRKIIAVEQLDNFKPVAINANLFLKFLMKVTSEKIRMVNQESKSKDDYEPLELVIVGGNFRCKLPVIEIDKWLELDRIENPNYEVTIASDVLRRDIESCMHAVGLKSNNMIMQSVYMHYGSGFSAMAVDGFRISVRDGCNDIKFSLLVDGIIMKELIKILNGIVTVAVKGQIAMFSDGKSIISVIQTRGKYYNLEPLIGQHTHIHVHFNRIELINALEAVTVIKNIVVIRLHGDKAVVSTRESTGDVTVELDVTNNVDYDFQIALNSSYLIEALKSLREEVVMLEFISKISPIIIREGNALELVLPVNMR